MDFLIVDDHAGIRSLIRECVTPFARSILECSSGECALQSVRKHQPDCATVDFRMEGVDGVATIRALREIRPDIHLILVSQFVGAALHDRAIAAGADAVIHKDHLTDLIPHLEKHVAARGHEGKPA